MGIDKTHLIGRRFGQLTILSWAERRKQQSLWNCRCDCGTETIVYYSSLISGTTKSCGCLRGESHGMSHVYGTNKHAREYKAWQHAKGRCFNKSDKKYVIYGARGITMCSEWKNSFSAFYEHMGPCPDGLTLDRIDGNRNYEPGNCRWATPSQQANNLRTTIRITLPNGSTSTFTEIAAVLGTNRRRVKGVYERGGVAAVCSFWSKHLATSPCNP